MLNRDVDKNRGTLENIDDTTTGRYNIQTSRDDRWCSDRSSAFWYIERKRHVEIFTIVCTVNCHFDNFRQGIRQNLRQNDCVSWLHRTPVGWDTYSFRTIVDAWRSCDYLTSGMVFRICIGKAACQFEDNHMNTISREHILWQLKN